MTWRQVAKKIAYWTVPPGIYDLLRTFLISNDSQNYDDILTIADKELLHKNLSLRNRHRGERCFILATGPSIKKQNLKLLQGEICIAVSNFFVHPDYNLIRPKYYCIAPYHSPITEEAWQKWMDEIEAATKDTIMFFSLTDRERNCKNGRFGNKQVHFLDLRGGWDPLLVHGVDLARPIPAPQSVTVMALLVALYMGFESIYLLGCDHDWILHLNVSSHFYNENQHALNRQGYDEWFGTDLESQCHDYIRLWQQYKAIRKIAQNQFTQVYNATEGGLLDVFPRIKLQSLFEA